MRKSFYRNYGIVKNRRDFQQAVVGTDSVTCFSSRLCNGLNDSPQAIQTQSQKEKKIIPCRLYMNYIQIHLRKMSNLKKA